MQITLNIPDGSDLAKQVESWQDGQNYEFGVTQTAPQTFDVVSAEPAEPEDTTGGEAEGETGGESDMGGSMPMHKNPAIAIVMGGKSGK